MIRKIVVILVVVLSVFVRAAAVQGQSDFTFSHFKSADGLPHQQIQSMAFDRDGLLWIGTRNGLASYDGYMFRNYYHIPGNAGSLPDNFVQKVFVDSQGRLWVGIDNSFCRYRSGSDDFETIDLEHPGVFNIDETPSGDIIASGSRLYVLRKGDNLFMPVPRQKEGFILGMAVAPDGRVFLSTHGSLSYFDKDLRHQTEFGGSIVSNFLMNSEGGTAPLFFDSKGNLWVGIGGNGVMCIDVATGNHKLYDSTTLSSSVVRAIAEDKQGHIWLGTEVGINILDPATGEVTSVVQDLVNPSQLNDNAIYCIVPDAYDNMWIGTYFGGVNMVRNRSDLFRWISPGYDNHSLHGKTIRRIVEPRPGELWLASEDGGLNILETATGNIRHFDSIARVGHNVHELLYDDTTSNLWIGTFMNELFRYNLQSGAIRRFGVADGLGSQSVFTMVCQPMPDGEATRLWVGTTQGLRYFDPATNTFQKIGHSILDDNFVYSTLVDSHGNLWVGTMKFGLFRVDRTSGEICGWGKSSPLESEGIHDCYITALLEDAKGRVYAGTNNGGLYYFESGSMKVNRFGDNTSNYGTVCSLTTDHFGNVWMSTSNGLYQIDPETHHMHHYTVADGLHENQFNFNSALEASDGRMYFGTVNGLVSFSPDLTKQAIKERKVHFSGLIINGKDAGVRAVDSPLTTTLDSTDVLKLNYAQSRQFGLDYGVIAPEGAESTSYQVKVDGIDGKWRDVGKLRRFTAMELAPGSYTVNVRASSTNDQWESAPVSSLKIKIAPPFYRSVWAYGFYLIVLCMIAYALWRLFNMRMREKQSMRMARLEQDKSDELNREKLEFFTNISHELKTPLSLIVAPLKYLDSSEELSDNARKRLEVALANTNKMVGLIDELVTFNRVETGNLQLYLQYGNPLDFIEKVASGFYEVAKDRKQTLRIFTENNGEEVWYSTTFVERILNNLISNAVKYTPEGGEIDVRASIDEDGSTIADNGRHKGAVSNPIYLTIEVRDTGIGIAPEEQENIFRKYYQTGRGYNADHQGWGIGLATVRKLVEMHRGTISVESKVGEGSSFKVKLLVNDGAFDTHSYIASNSKLPEPEPSYRRVVTESVGMTTPSDNAQPRADLVNILLVEDNAELLSFLSDTFSQTYNVYTATNGVEALKIAAEYPLDIIVSDVMMPEMDGIELCNRLKNDLATSHIPVILLTAKSDEQSTMLGFESGAEAYVSKPFDPQMLELRVRNILRARSKYIKSIIEHTEPVEETSEEMPTFNKFDQDFMARINALIEKNIDNSSFSIADITREFGISRSLLHIKMKTFANASMTDYLRRKRMELAKSLLRQGYNVSETSYRTGYSDPNYFTKVFKKEFGCTPSEYAAQG